MRRFPSLVLLAAAAALPLHPASAQDAAVNACPAEAAAIAKGLSDASRIPLRTASGPLRSLPSWADWAPEASGCLMQGAATGITQPHDRVLAAVTASLKGWRHEVDQDADGPGEATRSFAKGARRLILTLSSEPPAGACEDVVYADCKVPTKRWSWSLKAAMYSK